MQRGDPVEFNFKVIEMQRWNISTVRAQRLNEKNGATLSIYHVYSQSNGH